MKTVKWLVPLLLVTSVTTVSQAQPAATSSYQQARVLSATPIYESVRVPSNREVCWDEEVTYRKRPSPTSTLLGGVIGGAIGHQFGKGHGQDAMTIAGVLIGASIGNDAARKKGGAGYTKVERRCRTATEYYDEERITGYRVQYEYNGQTYNTRMNNPPGEYLDLQVSVSPIGD